MKAEQRKQLETNVLADRMGRLIKDVRKGPSRRGLLVWVVVILLIAGGAIFYFIRGNQYATQSDLWSMVARANIITIDKNTGQRKLNKELADTYKNSDQSKAARFQLAFVTLWDEGIKNLFRTSMFAGESKKTPAANLSAIGKILQAMMEYEALYKECSDDPIWGPEALYNMGVAQESLSIYELKYLDQAKTTLKSLVNEEKYAKSSFAQKARERLKKYETSEFRQFYVELHTAFQAQHRDFLKTMRQNKK